MAALGMLILGAFVGYIVTFGLVQVKDWANPVATLNGILSATVAGGLFALIERVGENGIGQAIYFYPVGLGYGALCTNLRWMTREKRGWLQILHLGAFAAASALLLGLMLSETMRDWLPNPPTAAAGETADKSAPASPSPER